MSENSKALHIASNLLTSIGYADSAGLPVETKPEWYIQRHFGHINSLHAIDNPYYGKAPAGSVSDDTILSVAVAEALIAAGHFSLATLGGHQVAAMNQSPKILRDGQEVPRGWGDSTVQGLKRFELNALARPTGNPDSKGNDVLIKLAPLAYWQIYGPPSQDQDAEVEQFTTMTHNNHLAIVTALVYRDILCKLAKNTISPEAVPGEAAEMAHAYEEFYSEAGQTTSRILGTLATSPFMNNRQEAVALAPSRGFNCAESLVMAFGAFARQPKYPASIFEAINYGGDTDSIGSMVAAMSVMHAGSVEQPADFYKLIDHERLHTIGQNLAHAALK